MSFHDLQVKYRRLQDPQAAKAGWDFIYEHTEHKCIHFHGCKVRHHAYTRRDEIGLASCRSFENRTTR